MEGKRQVAYDILRILAICMVVIIHANVATIAAIMGWRWAMITVLTSILTVAVPIFFMISGALLLDVKDPIDIKTLFQRRIKKIFAPFIIWSNIYVVVRIIMGKLPLTIGSFIRLIEKPAYYQFWFMYSLLAIYLLLPVLQRMLLKCSKQIVEYMLILWCVFSLLVPMLEHVFHDIQLCEHFDLNFVEGYLGYFILGYYLKKYKSSCTIKKALLYLLSGMLLTVACVVIEQTVKDGMCWKGYFMNSYLTPFVMLYSIGVFEFVVALVRKYETQWRDKAKCGVMLGAKLSMGVFYIHMLVLTALEHTGWLDDKSVVMLMVKIAITISCSFGGSYIISKVPVLRKLVV